MIFDSARVPLGLIWLVHVFLVVYGFNFSVSTPGQCDPLSVSWSGGQPPFQLLVVPPGGIIRNISIPTPAFDYDGTKGTYTIQQLNLSQGAQLMLSMSDATGIFAGGTSALMTVGPSYTHQACNTSQQDNDFYFSLDSTLAQCSPYLFTHYEGAVLPITILVHIPEGQSFVMHPSPANSFAWTANLTAGTPAAFSVYDAWGRIGGTSSIRVVQLTNDISCLSSVTPSNPSPQHNNTVKRLAVGISIGILGLLGLTSLIGFYCYRQSKQRESRSRSATLAVDLTCDGCAPELPFVGYRSTSLASPGFGMLPDDGINCEDPSIRYKPEPFLAQSPQTRSHPRSAKWVIENQDTSDVPTAPTNITPPSGVIVHTDISESLDGLLELPPQYSGDRLPLPSVPSSSMGTFQIRHSV
ncbi:hypothetical protein AX15_001791 [Amanita polypyramis BW_CC]|nr:hypothetical protein AX15_001791 [Amanita polypyramis BW_CC]